ncbi:unnamed protein product, partial [Allacma fusca]
MKDSVVVGVEVFTNRSSKLTHEWGLEYKGSPGNLSQFEDLLFNNNEITVNNGVVGIKTATVNGVITVGVAHINTNECTINLLEFADGEGFNNFESVLVQLSPKEAVVVAGASQSDDLTGIRYILQRNRVLVNERPQGNFDTKNITQDMNKLLTPTQGELSDFATNPELEKQLALSALAAAIKYLELASNEDYLNQFKLQQFDFHLHVKMDTAACRALNVDFSSEDESSKNEITLIMTLNKCRTAQGQRLLAQYLKQPLLDKERLEERLDLVEILVDDALLRQNLYDDHLRRIPDCQILARKFMKKKGALQDYYKGYLCVSKLGRLIELLENYDGPKHVALSSVFIEPLKLLQEDFAKFCSLIENTLDLQLADQGEFVVRPEFDSSLQELRIEMDKVQEKMSSEAYSVASQLGLEVNKSLKLESNGQYGHYFRITLKDETAIRNVAGFNILDSHKGGVRFRNTELERLSSKYASKHNQYEVTQKDFVRDLLEASSTYYIAFEQLGNVTSALDVFTSFAVSSVGNAEAYVRPTLLPRGTGKIRLDNLRHPCLETQKGMNFIPNDVNFEKGKSSFYIVTGPNMGGKSTFLRSIGVAALLAHVGCFVPATFAEISMVDAILARVGAGDCLLKGVSTFMAEMIETSFILKAATSDSLVLVDELGRGTSTYDGFGLCWSIAEHLSTTVDCYGVLATHFHELTDLATQVPTVKNLHVVAITEETGLQMMYKLERGPCDRSFGLHVAKTTEFPENVLAEAKKMASKLEDFASENDLDDTPEGIARRRTEKKEGTETINEMVEQLKDLADKCETEEQFQAEIDHLIAKANGIDNNY